MAGCTTFDSSFKSLYQTHEYANEQIPKLKFSKRLAKIYNVPEGSFMLIAPLPKLVRKRQKTLLKRSMQHIYA